jgi:hypothetical protein
MESLRLPYSTNSYAIGMHNAALFFISSIYFVG